MTTISIDKILEVKVPLKAYERDKAIAQWMIECFEDYLNKEYINAREKAYSILRYFAIGAKKDNLGGIIYDISFPCWWNERLNNGHNLCYEILNNLKDYEEFPF